MTNELNSKVKRNVDFENYFHNLININSFKRFHKRKLEDN